MPVKTNNGSNGRNPYNAKEYSTANFSSGTAQQNNIRRSNSGTGKINGSVRKNPDSTGIRGGYSNSVQQPRYSVEQAKLNDDGTKTYEFSLKGSVSREGRNAVPKYVLDKNGRRIEIHSKAEYQKIRLETERAVRSEHLRMLEEAALHKAEKNMKTVTVKSMNRLSFRFWIAVVACTMLFMVIILNFVLINERNRQISSLENEISSLQDEKSDLEEEIEQKNDLIYIEDYATEVLGMVKADRLSRMYVSIDTKDKIELSDDEESSDEITSSDVFENILDKIKAFWENIN